MTRLRAAAVAALAAQAALVSAEERHLLAAPGEAIRVVEAGQGKPVVEFRQRSRIACSDPGDQGGVVHESDALGAGRSRGVRCVGRETGCGFSDHDHQGALTLNP